MTRLSLGISTCPNDTFLFHGLLTGRSDPHGLELDFTLADVQELNVAAAAGRFDLAKASYAAALAWGDRRVVMPVGSALGFGVGPLLLARSTPPALPGKPRVLCPGEGTTAALLYTLFHPGEGSVEHALFSDIMPALERGEADMGVCIHEGRFTYAESGLDLVEDLGERWEQATDLPLPLGGLFARRDLGPDLLERLHRALQDSLAYGHAHRDETEESMAKHAQEFDTAVLFQHVDLYVNEWTRDLGPVGRAAIEALQSRAGRELPGPSLGIYPA